MILPQCERLALPEWCKPGRPVQVAARNAREKGQVSQMRRDRRQWAAPRRPAPSGRRAARGAAERKRSGRNHCPAVLVKLWIQKAIAGIPACKRQGATAAAVLRTRVDRFDLAPLWQSGSLSRSLIGIFLPQQPHPSRPGSIGPGNAGITGHKRLRAACVGPGGAPELGLGTPNGSRTFVLRPGRRSWGRRAARSAAAEPA